MKHADINLSCQEVEELCSLYMQCSLSVLEERQLEYVLSKISYSSPQIDATRLMMNLAPKAQVAKPTSRFRRTAWLTAAAAIFAIFTIGIAVFFSAFTPEYEGFAKGRSLNPMEARIQAIEQSKNVDEIIDVMDVMILEKQLQYENFNKNLALYE
ncbi:MAG: hypothetical protein HDT09_02430 [Bacteroidales bacterium]|nr:hypothetical protein [Bacteroidales bacterium]